MITQLIDMLREEAERVLYDMVGDDGAEFASVMIAAADELERNRWRRFGDEQPEQGAVVHVRFSAGNQDIAHRVGDSWNALDDFLTAQPGDMWRPANLPVNSNED